MNRLAQETSPYLLQHAHNPVDWYAWGDEAFAAARSQNKPVFLSVGYSTCYWCHVMERQCFENPAIADEMNRRFINVKVDREERPDVDQLYMLAVQVLTRQGGWPMSVFLTPDLRPFYGGTYFPPEDGHGRPGFPTVLKALDDAYRQRGGDVEKSAAQLVEILGQFAGPAKPQAAMVVDDVFVDDLIERSVGDYDARLGGFGGAPKFPRETLLELLLVHADRSARAGRKSTVLPKVLHTLDAMAAGGIRDHLGGGFHRYSTDAKWLVPHFEIMLYDNAMLGWCYAEAFRQTRDAKHASVARGIFDFILREMTSPAGAFYTALDAEVDSREGLNYLWTAGEITQVLGADDAAMFNRVYGVDEGPNFADPHHGNGRAEVNVLFQAHPIDDAEKIAAMRAKLLAARSKRKQPLLDTKILTSWNALMIRALAFGGQVLGESAYVAAAVKGAEFLLKHHRTSDGGLYRTSRDGKAKIRGFLDDYAFLVQALIALSRATGEPRWRRDAETLADVMIDKFGDASAGGLFFTDNVSHDLFVRQKVASDSPLPSGNAVAAMALLELGRTDDVRRSIEIFAPQMQQNGEGMSAMVLAAMKYLDGNPPIDIAASADARRADRPLSPPQLAAKVVSMKAEWTSATELAVEVSILAGFHINGHEASEGLLATQLSVSGDGPAVAAIRYPAGREERFAFSDTPVRVYSGQEAIAVTFQSAPTKGQTIKLALFYQACDDNLCLPPVTQSLEVSA